MAADSGLQSSPDGTTPGTVAPGAMSALLRELAVAPETELPRAWSRSLRPGMVVGRFELLRELGRGGFGVVYEARDRALGRLVAFKAVRPGARAADRQRQEWLWREAEAAAQLAHPNIVTLYDVGTSELGPYLVFELLHGETLDERLKRGALSTREAVALATGVARALAYAHAAGVVHRDLKPANVFLTEDGGVKVLDFGLAHVFGTSALAGGGTPTFMAPEQWRGGTEDARTDVFGFGALLFAALTGKPPYELVGGRATVLDGAPAPRPVHEGAPRALADLVQRSLAPAPADRPSDGGALLRELVPIERAAAARPRGALRWGLALLAAAAVAGTAALVLVRRSSPAAPPPGSYVVAVADVVNETGEPDLDSLSGLLITSLEQSRRFRVLTRSRLRDLLREMGEAPGAHVDEAAGRAAAARAHANAVLVPAVRRFGGIYSVEVKGLDPVSDSYLFGFEERGPDRQSLPALIDRVSARTRRALHESAQEIETTRIAVAESVTPDLEAYRHYFLGIACYDDGSFTAYGCADHFRRALQADPAFALAQYQLAYLAEFGAAPAEEQRQAFDAALKHLDRFPARERMYVLAWREHLRGDDAGAAATYDRLLAAYPDDKTAQYLAGDLQFHLDEPERAIPHLERAWALDPRNLGALSHLVDALDIAGRGTEALALARRGAAEHPGAQASLVLASALASAGDPSALDAAREAVRTAAPLVASEAELMFQHLLAFFGQYAEAEGRARAFRSRAPAAWAARAQESLAAVLALRGRRAEALEVVRAATGPRPAELEAFFHGARFEFLLGTGGPADLEPHLRWLREHDPHHGGRAAALAYVGQLRAAAEAARGLPAGSRDARAYRAVLRWREGDPSGAADELAPLASRLTARGMTLALEPWLHAEALAEALAEAGRDAEAIAALRRFQRTWFWPATYRSWAYPRSLYLLARAHAHRGERDEALRVIGELLRAWDGADRGAPLLAEAKALRASLAPDGAVGARARPLAR